MPSSDSEGFESADEGHNSPVKRDRNRLSSSNYSKNSDQNDSKAPVGVTSNVIGPKTADTEADGWDDFGIDEESAEPQTDVKTKPESSATVTGKDIKIKDSKDTGWEDFDDWGEGDTSLNKMNLTESTQPPSQTQSPPDTKPVTGQSVPPSNSWGWGGWGVDSLLSSATAGITTLTSHVSQGISTVLETGIGAPDPEDLARRTATEKQHNPAKVEETTSSKASGEPVGASDAFQFGSLISGVTKFVESTSTKVIAGGLDTLETIGKKTMEVLQDGDPGLAKKRAMLGLDSGEKVVLSQVLREAKAKADEEDRLREQKREAKQVHYENLFDDFEGLVHLEALEMLSKQVCMRIEEKLRSADPEKRQDIKETLQQVAELCEMPEDDDDDEEDPPEGQSKPEAFHEKLQTATQDIGLKLQFQAIVNHYKEVIAWISSQDVTEKATYTKGVCFLAQSTALSVEIYHKTAEMLLVKTRRSTADEADALAQMTVVLKKHVSDIATLFTEKLNTLPEGNKEQINNYITNLFLEAGNSSTYIQNAFQLALPILQIGAV